MPQIATLTPHTHKRMSAPRAENTTRRRWAILRMQLEQGHEPCFSTDKRYACTDHACPWQNECRALRAEWRR
jgi:hypothetical protein